MNKGFKAFTTSLMGSMPRSRKLIEAQEELKRGLLEKEAFEKIVLTETKEIVRIQEESGIDVIVHGELTRDNYMSFVADKVNGIQLMTMNQIADLSKDKTNFERSLEEMDAADNSMNNPVAINRIETNRSLDYEQIKQLKTLTNKPIKATLPSPYLLTRSMWMEDITGEVYEDRKELGKDVVKLIVNEVKRLISLGVDIIQIDEPILSDIVFNREDASNSFY